MDSTAYPTRRLAVALALLIAGPPGSPAIIPAASFVSQELGLLAGNVSGVILAASAAAGAGTAATGGWLLGRMTGSKVIAAMIAVAVAFVGFFVWLIATYPAIYITLLLLKPRLRMRRVIAVLLAFVSLSSDARGSPIGPYTRDVRFSEETRSAGA